MPLSNRDRDAVIRTVIGEAGNQSPEGQAAVAHVIMNRAASGNFMGKTPYDIVHSPSQFTSWQQHGTTLADINPQSEQYQNVGQIVDSALSGDAADPTNGATYFLNPNMVAKAPKWASGNSLTIGDHNFYNPADVNYPTQNSPDIKSVVNAALAMPPNVKSITSAAIGISPSDQSQ